MRVKQVESEITLHIGKKEAELTLKLNNAAYFGDLYQMKSLIRAGADPNKPDYDGRTPLVHNICFSCLVKVIYENIFYQKPSF